MDDLNPQQIVLLTLLVSFVTSIATGIITVALLEQAPDPVTQTINRVVEKTVERVITEPSGNQEVIIEREVVTVVVNEEDLTVEAVERNSRSVVRIFKEEGENKNFITLGLVANQDGDIVVPSNQISEGTYLARFTSGEFRVSIERRDDDANLALLKIQESDDSENPRNFRPVNFTNSNLIQLGQSIIAISGEARTSVSTGIIQSIINDDEIENRVARINTSILPHTILSGTIVVNLKGELIGMRTMAQVEDGSFTPSDKIRNFINNHDATI